MIDNKHRPLVLLTVATTTTIVCGMTAKLWMRKKRRASFSTSRSNTDCTADAYESLIGNTPLLRLNKLSSVVGRDIYAKMESLNPGGTGKDRAALAMLRDACATAQKAGQQVTTVVEGTSGSTGISLASLCVSRGYECIVYMPDDQAPEKRHLLRSLGAQVIVVPNCAIANPQHYVNRARRHAETCNEEYRKDAGNHRKLAVFINQFENGANFHAHYTTTGPEIHEQMTETPKGSGRAVIDAFVMSSGTGGTLSGVGTYLKRNHYPNLRVVLADPPGSSLYNKIKHGVAFAEQQRERSLRRHRYDTIAEGVGLDRVTHNFALGCADGVIDDAVRVTDQEMVDMAHWLLREEGLFVGSSSAMNIVAAVRIAHETLRPGSRVVTVVCDGGQRHLTRFWNRDFIVDDRGLEWPRDGDHSNNTTHLPDCIARAMNASS